MKDETYFDRHVDSYADDITHIQPAFYENSATIINGIVQKDDIILDIGNGGVINYDTSSVRHLDCADIILPSAKAVKKYESNPIISFVLGDITDLRHFENNSYDVVIVQTVIHHLAKNKYKDTIANVKKAISECMRVCKNDGTVIIIESTVGTSFEIIEKIFYYPMQCFFKIVHFGLVYQFSYKSLLHLLLSIDNIDVVENGNVDVGKYIWIMGKKMLRSLTPCGAHYYILKKR